MAYLGNTPTTQAFTPAIDYFSGNGSTTAFTLSRPVASVAQVQVVIDNVAQNPSSAYTVSSNTITFTSAPLSGTNNIYVYYTSPITQVIAPGQGTVTATSMASSTGTGAGVFATSPTITTPTIDTITSAASTALNLKSAGTTAIYADTSQNVGIGNTSPSASGAKLAVTPANTTGSSSYLTFDCTNFIDSNFQVSVTGSASTDKRAVVGTTTTTALALQTNGTERMRINSSGYVGIGVGTPVVGQLDINRAAIGNRLPTIGASAVNFAGGRSLGGTVSATMLTVNFNSITYAAITLHIFSTAYQLNGAGPNSGMLGTYDVVNIVSDNSGSTYNITRINSTGLNYGISASYTLSGSIASKIFTLNGAVPSAGQAGFTFTGYMLYGGQGTTTTGIILNTYDGTTAITWGV